MEAFRRAKAEKTGLSANAREILSAIAEMPDTMRKLGPVQLCTWLGLFCMWLYFPVAVAHNVFGANDTELTALSSRSGMGRHLLRGLFHRLLRFLVCLARPGQEARPQKHAHHLPDLRSSWA